MDEINPNVDDINNTLLNTTVAVWMKLLFYFILINATTAIKNRFLLYWLIPTWSISNEAQLRLFNLFISSFPFVINENGKRQARQSKVKLYRNE